MRIDGGGSRGTWLGVLETGYPAFLVVLTLATAAALTMLLLRWRASRRTRVFLARVTLAGMTTLLGVLIAEGTASLYLAWVHRLPRLAMSVRPRQASASEDVSILVVGESSAEGVPYKDWLSVGKVVTWQLRRAFPQRMFHLEVQARAGWTLEQMHQKLAEPRRAPDAVILYAGHNEFASRFGWSDSVRYYEDEPLPSWPGRLIEAAAAYSPLSRLIAEAAARERIAARPSARHRSPVDVPSYSPSQYRERLADFRSRLALILADLRRAGVLTVVIVPPGNDAGFEPSRSVLPPNTPRQVRDAFAAALAEARAMESVMRKTSAERYRSLIAEQPGFAEAHFRLARLLERDGQWDEAYRHYLLARDLDGHPMRCPSEFQDVYRQLAPAFDAILVDGQAILHERGPHGLLDDRLFNDAMHPSLVGHTWLAEAVLAALKDRGSFGWASSVSVPTLDPAECAEHFDVTAATWKAVCRFAAGFYRATLPIRFDPSEREAKARRYEEAIEYLDAGVSAARVGCPGIGISLALPGRNRTSAKL